jgi:hypothetical protein
MTFAGPCVIGATCAKFKLAANAASNESPRNRRTAGRLRQRCYQTERSGSICFAAAKFSENCRTGASVDVSWSASGALALQADRILTFESRFALLFLSGSRFPMKTSFRLLAVVFALIAVNSIHAGDFISQVLQANQSLGQITVPGGHFLIIRSFTQEVGGTHRGFVSVTKDGSTIINAFVASVEDPSILTTPFNEPVNEFVVAGPSTVTVTCGDTTSCFITYRKGQD